MPKGIYKHKPSQGYQKGNKIGNRFKTGHKSFGGGTKGKHWKIKDTSKMKGKLPWNKGQKGLQSHSEETKKKISNSMKGKERSDEHRKNLSIAFTGRKHTDATKKKLSDYFKKHCTIGRGENNPNYKHGNGYINEMDKVRKSIQYIIWRNAIYSKNGFICQKCKNLGGKLVAHHIQNFAQWPELRFAIDNGITLCWNCHKKFHKKYGNRNNNQEQIKEFISINL